MIALHLLGLLWLQILLHEAAHAVAVLAVGSRLVSFKPWPHFADGRFVFGRVMQATRASPGYRHRLAAIGLAPIVMGCIAVPALTMWAAYYPSATVVAAGGFMLFDTALHLLQPLWARHGDLHDSARVMKWNMRVVITSGIISALLLILCWVMTLAMLEVWRWI